MQAFRRVKRAVTILDLTVKGVVNMLKRGQLQKVDLVVAGENGRLLEIRR
jgi:hypothetical protein